MQKNTGSRFIKGKSGNPSGRPKGIKDRRTDISLFFNKYKDLFLKEAIKKCTEGDSEMIELLIKCHESFLSSRIKASYKIHNKEDQQLLEEAYKMYRLLNKIIKCKKEE